VKRRVYTKIVKTRALLSYLYPNSEDLLMEEKIEDLLEKRRLAELGGGQSRIDR
jgi:hypothetical protein